MDVAPGGFLCSGLIAGDQFSNMKTRDDKVAEIQRARSRQKRASRIRFVNIEV